MPIFQDLTSSSLLSKREQENAVLKTAEELFFSNVPFNKICAVTPRHVMANRSFIVDTTKLEDTGDLIADDCGGWKNNGQHNFKFDINENELIRLDDKSLCASVILQRTYYNNRSSKDFRRIISFVMGKVC